MPRRQPESSAVCNNEPVAGTPLPSGRIPAGAGRIDLLLLVAINFMWALKWTLAKIALRELQPVSITLFPMVGSILLLVPLLRKKLQGQPTYLGVFRKVALRPANVFRFLLLGVAGQVVTQVLTSWGLKYVPATDAAFYGLATPIFNAILAVVIVGEALELANIAGVHFRPRRGAPDYGIRRKQPRSPEFSVCLGCAPVLRFHGRSGVLQCIQ